MMKKQVLKKTMAAALALTLVGGVSTAIGGKDIFPPAIVAKADGEPEPAPIEGEEAVEIAKGSFFNNLDNLYFGDEAVYVKDYSNEAVPVAVEGHKGAASITISSELNCVKLIDEEDYEYAEYMYIDPTFADTKEVCTDASEANSFRILGSGTEADPFYAAPVKNAPQTISVDSKQTATKDGVNYTRFVFVKKLSELEGKNKAVFTATLGEDVKTAETSTYYTSLISNGTIYTPFDEESVFVIVTISSAKDLTDLECTVNFE
ncbi:hypothetical protein [Ruminococcus flavefaciens]|nr:hypothetical protein [Ruminococcus flavefaciens]